MVAARFRGGLHYPCPAQKILHESWYMSVRILSIDRIPHTVPIRIQPTPPKGTPTVRAVEPHQHRVKRPIAIAQQITSGYRIRPFTVESEQAEQAVFRGAMTVWRIGEEMGARRVDQGQHGALLIGGEQVSVSRAGLALLVGQQVILILHDRVLERALNLGD